jgi:hypothetical protein
MGYTFNPRLETLKIGVSMTQRDDHLDGFLITRGAPSRGGFGCSAGDFIGSMVDKNQDLQQK